jgi:SpoIID/LytB domain protein
MGPIPREMHRRVGLFLALLAAAFLTTTPAVGGATIRTFTFYGSGYGHGLGLSQWGAYGMAQQGKTYRQILTHFYKGTTVEKAPSAPWNLRIGLVQSKRLVHLTAVGGRVELRLRGAHVAWIPEGKTWTVAAASDGSYLVKDAAGAVFGGKTWGSTSHGLVVANGAGAVVKVGETGHTYKRGTIEFNTSRACDGCAFRERLIAVLRPQLYLYGIGEVSSSWPTQSLETQAVAARTYAFEKVSRLGQHRPECNCALYATVMDQNYVGWDKESGYLGSRWVDAVDRTAGQVVMYRGALIQAYYHASSGGFTENNENVWGGTPLPYLRGVCDPGDFTSANPVRTWEVAFTDAALTTKLAAYTGPIGTVTGFSGAVRGVSGRIESITVVGTADKATISGGALRAALGLRDRRVWIGSNRNVTGAIRGKYDALMCAPGAAAGSQKAVPGGRRQAFATGALYRNAANGRVIWLRGSVFSRYVQLGDASGPLGIPVSGTRTVTLPSGCRKYHCSITRFAGGGIYFKGATGVGIHELHGALYRYFRSLGGARSRLGFPTSDVKLGAGGRTSATFEGGTITCSAKGACSRS